MVRVRPLRSLALVFRAIFEPVVHRDLLDHEDFVFEEDFALGL